jgi:hypothetical protein
VKPLGIIISWFLPDTGEPLLIFTPGGRDPLLPFPAPDRTYDVFFTPHSARAPPIVARTLYRYQFAHPQGCCSEYDRIAAGRGQK